MEQKATLMTAPSTAPTSMGGSRAQNKINNFPKTKQSEKEGGWKTISVEPHTSKFKKKIPKKYLEVGMGVICIHNKVRNFFCGRCLK